MSKVTLEELKEHCIRMIQRGKRLGYPEDDLTSQKYKIFLQLIKEHKQRQSTDAVSRKAVVKSLCELGYGDEENGAEAEYMYALRCVADKVKALPPVTPKAPKGKWIDEVDDFGEITAFHCSNCYEDTGFFTKCKWDFCPKCGADMRGVSECSEENKN